MTSSFLRSNFFAREINFGSVLGRSGTGTEGREVGDYNLVKEGRAGGYVEEWCRERYDESF